MAIPHGGSGLSGEEFADGLAGVNPRTVPKQVDSFLSASISVSFDTCVKPWQRARMFRKNKQIIKEEETC